MWPPGQPADVKSGRLVFNTNVHGAVFNTAAGKQVLARWLQGLQANPASVFPPSAFGRMVLNGGYALRLVNEASYPCTCAGGCRVEGREGTRLWVPSSTGCARFRQGLTAGAPRSPALPPTPNPPAHPSAQLTTSRPLPMLVQSRPFRPRRHLRPWCQP